MPRAAVLSIHARMYGTEPTIWEDRSLVQIRGPRYSAYAVARRDVPVLTLGRLPDDARAREQAQITAAQLKEAPAHWRPPS